MANEIYRAWDAGTEIPDELYFEELRDDADALHIFLKSKDSEKADFCLRFQGPIAYRVIDETYRLRTYNRANMRDYSTFLTVENSRWITWLREESGGVLDATPVVHYAIFTDNDCVDVLTAFPPNLVRLE